MWSFVMCITFLWRCVLLCILICMYLMHMSCSHLLQWWQKWRNLRQNCTEVKHLLVNALLCPSTRCVSYRYSMHCIFFAAFSSISFPLPCVYFEFSSGYLRGVEVIAETSIVITSQVLSYEWKGCGLKLHVPQNSLPANCSQCRITIKASLSGQYKYPDTCELVSGVYWIYCPVELSYDVMLQLQYNSNAKDGLKFLRADCTQKVLPYSFQELEGGQFSEHCYYGSIYLSRFSGLAIGWFRSLFGIINHYSLHVYYAEDALCKHNTWQVIFAIRCTSILELEEKVQCMSIQLCIGRSVRVYFWL